ncbi:hypothetical protein ACE41H_02195 [Paenibacillus enshidis]|uniref:Uncharacterized protein n=1 Tax=Paenibacillus enshidis TaxID=1458439 RepID=A0ABV5AN56_9BACL
MYDKLLLLHDDDREWRQFIQYELSKLLPDDKGNSSPRRVVPEALQFAFRHAASYLMAQLKKSAEPGGPALHAVIEQIPDDRGENHSNDDSDSEEDGAEEEEAIEIDNLDAEVQDSIAEPATSILEEEVESLNTEPALNDEEDNWTQFIQAELGKYQSGEADKSPIEAIASTVLPFAFLHLASYLLARLKKAGEQEEEVSDFVPERTPDHPESPPSIDEDGFEKVLIAGWPANLDREEASETVNTESTMQGEDTGQRQSVLQEESKAPSQEASIIASETEPMPIAIGGTISPKSVPNEFQQLLSYRPALSEKAVAQEAPVADSVLEQITDHQRPFIAEEAAELEEGTVAENLNLMASEIAEIAPVTKPVNSNKEEAAMADQIPVGGIISPKLIPNEFQQLSSHRPALSEKSVEQEASAVDSVLEQITDHQGPFISEEAAELEKEAAAESPNPVASEIGLDTGSVHAHTIEAANSLNRLPVQKTAPLQEVSNLPVGKITPQSLPMPSNPWVWFQPASAPKQTEQGQESISRTDAQNSTEQAIRTPRSRASTGSSQRKNRQKSISTRSFSTKRSLKRKPRRKARSQKRGKLGAKTALRRVRVGKGVRKSDVRIRKKRKIKVGKRTG